MKKQMAAVTLAVSMVAPTMLPAFASAQPAQAPATAMPILADVAQRPSDADLLKLGVNQYQNHQYEEAAATLQQIKADALNESGRKLLSETLPKARTAAAERKAARAEFDQGEKALKADQPAEAITHYQKAAQNRYADDGTKAKAKEQLALAQTMAQKAPKADANAAKAPAVKPAEAGAAGTAKSPKAQPAPDAPAANTAKTAKPVPALSKKQIRQAYLQGREEYKKGDWISARKNLETARDNGYKPHLFEDSPQKYLAIMDKKEASDRAKHEAEIAARRQAEQEAKRDAQLQTVRDAELQAAAKNPSNKNPVVATQAQASQPAGAGEASSRVETAKEALNARLEIERIKKQQQQYEARQLVQQARQAQAQNQTDEALRLFIRASNLDPANRQAEAGKQELLSAKGLSAAPSPTLTHQEQELRLQRERVRYQFDQSLNSAYADIEKNQFDAATVQLDRARNARDSNPNIWTQEEFRELTARVNAAQLTLDRTRTAYLQAQETANKTKAQDALNAARQQELKRREEVVAGLVNDSMRLTEQGKYPQALGVIDQILSMDPSNDYARGARPLIQDKANFQEQRTYREMQNANLTKQFNAAEEKMIPYDDIYRYPANWPDIVQLREESVKEERHESDSDQVVQAQLDKRLPEVKFDAVGLSDVIDFLRDVTGSNIFVNWKALELAGVDKTTPVTARLHNVKFSKALSTILSEVGGQTGQLGYAVDEGVITISTRDNLNQNVVTRVYDIRDLIFDVPDFTNAPDFNLQSISDNNNQNNNSGTGGNFNNNNNSSSGSGGLFGNTSSGGEEEEVGATRKEKIDEVTKLITDTIDNTSWKDNGGTVGSLRELNGQLIVTQTPENQGKLNNLLEQLRETRAIQVTIETRFLTVQRNFLEDIGLDFNFTLNPNHQISDKLGPITVEQHSSTFTQAPATPAPGSIGTNATGLVLNTTFLDDFSANFLLRATQASSTSTILTAPRVTLFNGQRAYVLVATQTAYVSNLQAVVGTNAVAFQPIVSVVESGALLDVQATVSADRKYVTLTLRPQLASLVALLQFGFQILPTTGVSPGIGNNNNSVVPNVTAGSGFIQEPILEITEVRTTVSVPDGGTLLLGGQTVAGEVEKEAGVPILSKIPFLKRLFTNRSMAKDEQVLLILVKPTIIIQREEEQRQFPLLSTNARAQ